MGICRNMEKFCLKWHEFEANIKESFKTLREKERLFDVTLATDDGQHVQAHKMVLSAGSLFFSDIFIKTNHSNMLIYLKGISSAQLEPVIQFLYNGEAFISQEYLTTLLGTAKELEIKGPLNDVEGIDKNEAENPNIRNLNIEFNAIMTESEKCKNIDNQESIHVSLEDLAESVDTQDDILVKTEDIIPSFDTNKDIDFKIKGMIEKNEGQWRCKVCGKNASFNNKIRQHAETHIEGVSHVCHICRKTTLTRHNLRDHISSVHSELFSCDICGKTGMNRKAYRDHKRTNHKAIQ